MIDKQFISPITNYHTTSSAHKRTYIQYALYYDNALITIVFVYVYTFYLYAYNQAYQDIISKQNKNIHVA